MSLVLAQGGGFDALQSLQTGFTTLIAFLPQLIGALLVLLIGYIIAKLIDKAVTKLLQAVRLDARLAGNDGGRFVEKLSPQGQPSRLIGTVLFWVIMVFVISSAIGVLGIPALTNFMNTVLSWLPNVIAALAIFIVAAVLAGAAGTLVRRTMADGPVARVAQSVVPALIMAIAVFMILTQLGIAPVIVTVTYVALIGAVALAAALAFGLGGRDAAADLIRSGYRSAQNQSAQNRSAQNQSAQNQSAQNQSAQNRSAPSQAQAQSPVALQPSPTTRNPVPGESYDAPTTATAGAYDDPTVVRQEPGPR